MAKHPYLVLYDVNLRIHRLPGFEFSAFHSVGTIELFPRNRGVLVPDGSILINTDFSEKTISLAMQSQAIGPLDTIIYLKQELPQIS